MPAIFGQYIIKRRKELGLSQSQLASCIFKEEGSTISAQYLNDIEHGRRMPHNDYYIEQLARILRVEADFLYYLAGSYPSDLRMKSDNPKTISCAFSAFRRALDGK